MNDDRIVHCLTAEHVAYAFDKQTPPVLTIRPGELIDVETLDARSGQVLIGSGATATDPSRVNPVTGPIAVEGAEPGDAIAVHIRHISVADLGYTRTRPTHGVLSSRMNAPHTRILRIEGDKTLFTERLRLSLRCMIGTIGVAPGGDAAGALWAGQHGGNMDHSGICEGSIVYLPVNVPGALLSLGDGHALMGDGELTGAGIETATATTLSVDLLKHSPISRPWVRSGGLLSTVGCASSTDAAVSEAAMAVTVALGARHGLSFEDAYLLMGLVGDGVLCQACQDGHAQSIVRVQVAEEYLNPWPEG